LDLWGQGITIATKLILMLWQNSKLGISNILKVLIAFTISGTSIPTKVKALGQFSCFPIFTQSAGSSSFSFYNALKIASNTTIAAIIGNEGSDI
jgi:hypothetical protein